MSANIRHDTRGAWLRHVECHGLSISTTLESVKLSTNLLYSFSVNSIEGSNVHRAFLALHHNVLQYSPPRGY